MVATDFPELDIIDDTQFAELIAQESVTIPGQIAKMKLIEDMIRLRSESLRKAARLQLQRTLTGEDISQALDQAVQPLRFHHLDLGDGRHCLIVEKGEDVYENGEYVPPKKSIFIPAHIDTVEGAREMLELRPHPSDPDRLMGLGTYDMGGAVLNNIALAASVRVRRSMKVYFVFTVDEEEFSKGARLIISQWDRWPEIDTIITSEIGPLPPPSPDDKRMRLIIGRSGRQKFVGTININAQKQGHGARSGLPNAARAKRELLNKLEDRFYHGFDDGPDIREAPLQREHPLLGKEEFEDGEDQSKKRKGYFPPHYARFEYALKTVPPSTRKDVRDWQLRIAKGVAKRRKWRDFGIDYQLVENPNEASYAPYCMAADHQLIQLASRVIEKLSGAPPVICGAPSVADECDYAEDMLKLLQERYADDPDISAITRRIKEINETKPFDPELGKLQEESHRLLFEKSGAGIINIPIEGDNAHHPDEGISRRDIARVREAIRRLIEDEDGLQSLCKQS